MVTLSDKLKSLGVKLGARDLPPPRRPAFAIEQVMPGRFQATPHGDAFVVETLYTPEYRHGQVGLRTTVSLQTMAEWAGERALGWM